MAVVERTNLLVENFFKMMHWISEGHNPAATDALAVEQQKIVESAGVVVTEDIPLLKQLAVLLEERESEIKRKKVNKFMADRWEMTQWAVRCREFNREKGCNHLKGGRRGHDSRYQHRDFNVSFHTFITGEQRIVCLWGCGFEVWNKPGWSFKWRVGMEMVEQSTNTKTASEVMMPCTPFKRTFVADPGFPYNGSTDSCLNIGDENPIRGRKENR